MTSEERGGPAERLRGRRFPEFVLPPSGRPLAERFGSGGSVLYTYHGLSGQIDFDSAMIDAAQHRAFRDLGEEWERRGISVIGLSTEPEARRIRSVVVNRLEHEIISDRELVAAEALELPTFTHEGQRCYKRLVLIVSPHGRIAHVFFPLQLPRRAAVQALTWLKLHGAADPPSAGTHA